MEKVSQNLQFHDLLICNFQKTAMDCVWVKPNGFLTLHRRLLMSSNLYQASDLCPWHFFLRLIQLISLAGQLELIFLYWMLCKFDCSKFFFLPSSPIITDVPLLALTSVCRPWGTLAGFSRGCVTSLITWVGLFYFIFGRYQIFHHIQSARQICNIRM